VNLLLLGGAPGVGKSTVAREVLKLCRRDTSEHSRDHPLVQWVDVDALWWHQPWHPDETLRAMVRDNLRAVLANSAAAGVDTVVLTWVFQSAQLRDLLVSLAPAGTAVTSAQLVASEESWRQRFAADPERGTVDEFYADRYASAQESAGSADLVLDTTSRSAVECADFLRRSVPGLT